MIEVEVNYSKSEYKKFAAKKKVFDYVHKVCEFDNIDNVSVFVSFVTESEIKEVNKKYRGIDDSTDILSFAENDLDSEVPFIDGSGSKKTLGEILICPEVLCNNAKKFNVKENEELHRLIIHGILHLIGLDHKTDDVINEPMLIHQEKILNKLDNPSKEDN